MTIIIIYHRYTVFKNCKKLYKIENNKILKINDLKDI